MSSCAEVISAIIAIHYSTQPSAPAWLCHLPVQSGSEWSKDVHSVNFLFKLPFSVCFLGKPKCYTVSVLCWGKKCSCLLKPGQSPFLLSLLCRKMCSAESPPAGFFFFHCCDFLDMNKEKLNISFRLICGLIGGGCLLSLWQEQFGLFLEVFFNPISSSRNQDHMCFHWSVLSDHSSLVPLNSPSPRLTHTQDFCRYIQGDLLLSWLYLLLRLTFTLDAGSPRVWGLSCDPGDTGSLALTGITRWERHAG